MIGLCLLGALQAPPVLPQGGGAGSRPSITFILGEDQDPTQPMFALAADHFRQDPGERSGDVVLGLRSLSEVRERLAGPRPGGGPWGVVNLVVHGNASGYLDLDLRPGGPKVGEASLAADLRRGDRPPLPSQVLDQGTEIRVHGCAAGRDRRVLAGLSRWFATASQARPVVRASLWFTSFQRPDPHRGTPGRSLCEWWAVTYRQGERPGPEALASRLRKAVERRGVRLDEALARHALERRGGVYSYESPVRFTWTLAFPDSRAPSLPPALLKAQWLPSQEILRQRLGSAGIGFQDLQWTVKKDIARLEGRPCEALVATGEGRVLHVLRQLVRGPGEAGPEPEAAWDDPRYYATVR